MSLDQPLVLDPVLVPKPWGGRKLGQWGRRLPDDRTYGESWDVSDLDPAATSVTDPASRVAVGPHAGASLRDLITMDRTAMLGAGDDVEGRFPLLVKTLDAREHLSVQVHPPAAQVAQDPTVRLKTESWVVVDADEDAVLYLGLADGVTMQDLRAHGATPAVADLMRRVPARVGDVHHVEAGTIHALGAGVVVAEVQTPSDTTFRLYDWTTEYGREPRELHVEQALQAMDLAWEHNVAPAGGDRPTEDATGTVVSTVHYDVRRHVLGAGETGELPGGRARVLMVVAGTVTLTDARTTSLSRGGVVVLPAACATSARAPDGATVIEFVAA